VQITTKNKLNGGTNPNIIARTQEYFIYQPEPPAIALLDFDQKGMPAAVRERIETLGGLWPSLLSVIPEFAGTARLERQSTSAGLFRSDTGQRLPSPGGQHIFLSVLDGQDIERFLKTLGRPLLASWVGLADDWCRRSTP
jgi:hypothetical protein